MSTPERLRDFSNFTILMEVKKIIERVNWEKIKEEATLHLSNLIKIDTTNPPGRELSACEYLKEVLSSENIISEIFISDKERGNIVSKIEGFENKEPLLLLSHLDVVTAEEGRWEIPPFSGKVIDNFIWGRGAIDCKGLVVQELMVFLLLKRMGISPQHHLIFSATADEEKGGDMGVRWLIDHHFEKIRARYVINEGGVGIKFRGKNFYFVQVSEKGICWFKIKAYGTAGHGSIPTDDNSIIHLSQIIDKISKRKKEFKITATAQELLKAFSREFKIPYPIIKLFINLFGIPALLRLIPDKGVRQMFSAMLSNTFTPTILRGGTKTNVIPSECEVEIDGRILPDEDPDKVSRSLKNYLNKYQIEIIPLEANLATESSCHTTFYKVISETLQEFDKTSVIVPFMQTSATDSRHLRQKNIECYGFSPLLVDGNHSEYLKMIHGHNEKISRDNLLFGIKILFSVVLNYNYFNKVLCRFKSLILSPLFIINNIFNFFAGNCFGLFCGITNW